MEGKDGRRGWKEEVGEGDGLTVRGGSIQFDDDSQTTCRLQVHLVWCGMV